MSGRHHENKPSCNVEKLVHAYIKKILTAINSRLTGRLNKLQGTKLKLVEKFISRIWVATQLFHIHVVLIL